MKIIGLIGGCGTGKSEVAQILKNNYNAYIITADDIGHDIIKKGTASYDKITKHFGIKILNSEGEINRKILGDIVFSNENELKLLNSFTHPYIYKKIENEIEQIKQNNRHEFIVLEAAVMIEAGLTELVDYTWVITCQMDIRIKRLQEYRNIPLGKIKKIIESQYSLLEYLSYSDYVIDNSEDINSTCNQIDQGIQLIKEDNHAS